MMLIFLMVLIGQTKEVEVRFTDTEPRIDGIIEEIWQQADSAYNFVQYFPSEKTEPEQKTVVFVLQDKDNIYVAIRCYAPKYKPVACLTKDEDFIVIGIDPFMSRSSGYYFWVYGSRIMWDGWILDNGNTRDDSWEGVWYRGVKVYDDHWDIEFKIPFKSIRYKKGLTEWGFQVMRYAAANTETDYWTEVHLQTGDLVSDWGILKNINPQATGYYFELYPEGYVRYDRTWFYDSTSSTDSTKYKPSISLNLKWDVTPQTTVSATAFPDFAQIEADPYTLNLGRYPVYLSERRPFFIEGSDILRMSGGNNNGSFQSIDIFYSRRIGRSVNGDAVPILGGLKVTNKSELWNIGFLSAYTDEYEHAGTVMEPDRAFSVMKIDRRILRNSNIGFIASGMYADTNDYNYALAFDGVHRQGPNQIILQSAFSQRNGDKIGWGITSGFRGFVGKFLTNATIEAISDSFDVSEIGFVPWAGRKRAIFAAGPLTTYPRGILSNLYYGPYLATYRTPGEDNWSYEIGFEVNPSFRNNWGFYAEASAGKQYEAGLDYPSRSANGSVWARVFGQQLNFGGNINYSYNYYRGYLAYQGFNWFTYNYSIIPELSAGLNTSMWIEWDTLNNILAVTPRIRPNVFIRFTAEMNITLFTELVYLVEQTDFSNAELYAMRSGFLFAWNFKPKSWLYIALNDYRAENGQEQIEPRYQVGAIKAKYLLYF